MNRAGLLLVALLVSTPVLAQTGADRAGASRASYMVGTWFGRGQPEDASSMYIDRMRADGSWRGEYRACLRDKHVDQVQTGRWTLDGDRLLLHVDQVDGVHEPRDDLYRMVTHDTRAQKYIALSTGFAYTPRRVDDGYKMPSCDLIS